MNNKLTPNLLIDALPVQDYTVLNGRDVLHDPDMAQLRRYVPVLAVIAAPYAGLGGDQDPLNPLDGASEWRLLIEAVMAAMRLQPERGVPLAMVRLVPPTPERLGRVLGVDSVDAFSIVHLVCHGERDLLYLEDENGHETYTVAEHVVRLFRPGRVRLVVMDGCFSQRIAQMLIDETSVAAVVGTRRKVAPGNALTFATQFYAGIALGGSVEQAFRAAVDALVEQADRFEMVTGDDLYEVMVPVPPADGRATRPLLGGGLPRMFGVPQNVGFIGRREMLTRLAEMIPTANNRLYAIYGTAGVGKTWLAAEFVTRFGWRFPGGTIWLPVNGQTTAQEIIAQVARLLELPIYTPPDRVLVELGVRRALVVLERVDSLAGDEPDQLSAFIQEIDPESGSCVIVTARDLPGLLGRIDAYQAVEVKEFAPKDARTLAMRLAVERDIEALDVDTIDDFLEGALNLPWLIVKGVELTGSDGLAYALDDLAAFKPDMPNPLELYLGRRLKLLALDADSPLGLLVRSQDLAEVLHAGLVGALGGKNTAAHVHTLLKYGLLRQEGELFFIPPEVRALTRALYPLRGEQQKQRDKFVINYLIRTWPDEPERDLVPLTREQQARLDNTRALLRRQMGSEHVRDTEMVAQLLIVAAPAFRMAGLAEEFGEYAGAIRERLPEGRDFARLQVALGDALTMLPDRQDEAGWTLQVTLATEGLDANVLAEASLAYARYLAQVGQGAEAGQQLAGALRSLRTARGVDVTLAASLAHNWARVLAASEQYEQAVARFEAALSGYAHTQRADLSTEAQYELSEALIRLGELDRAEDVLRRALMTADQVGWRALGGKIRAQLAEVSVIRAEYAHQREQLAASHTEWGSAEQFLCEAVDDLLPFPDTVSLAAAYAELGRVQARLSRMDDALANLGRGRQLFEGIRDLPSLAEASVTLGQVCMASGDSVLAQQTLHEALDLAAMLDDYGLATRAAGVLVRVHQIRARHAQRGDRVFRQNMLEQASFTRAYLDGLGLNEHVAALDAIMAEVAD